MTEKNFTDLILLMGQLRGLLISVEKHLLPEKKKYLATLDNTINDLFYKNVKNNNQQPL